MDERTSVYSADNVDRRTDASVSIQLDRSLSRRGGSMSINSRFPEHVPRTRDRQQYEELTSEIQDIVHAPPTNAEATLPLPNPAATGTLQQTIHRDTPEPTEVCPHLIAKTVHSRNWPYIFLFSISILITLVYVGVRLYYIASGKGSFRVPSNFIVDGVNNEGGTLTLGDAMEQLGLDVGDPIPQELIDTFPDLRGYVEGNTYSYWWSCFVLAAEIGGAIIVHYSQQMFIRQTTFFYKMEQEQELKLANVVRTRGKLQQLNIMVCTYSEPMETVRDCVRHLLEAPVPVYANRTIYIGDDGAKKGFDVSKEKRVMADEFRAQGHDVVWVGDRKSLPHQLNGKSSNINHMVLNRMYPHIERTADVPLRDILMVMDCDHMVTTDFFAKSCAVMLDPGVAVCLMPQSFFNEVRPDCFDNANYNFMFRMMPFYFGAGCCFVTGTNVMIRARAAFEACRFDENPHGHETAALDAEGQKELTAALGGNAHRQLFSEVLVAEDIELGSRVHTLGYRSVFLDEVLAKGEVPLKARDIWKQRSRWAKAAHMYVLDPDAVFWYKQKNMSFWQKSLYWIPIVLHFHVIWVEPIMFLMPIMCLGGDICPYGVDTLLWTTHFLKLFSTVIISSYAPTLELTKAAIFGQTMARVLFWVNVKAVLNTIMVYTGWKKPGAFKVTTKAAAKKVGEGVEDGEGHQGITFDFGSGSACEEDALSGAMVTSSADAETLGLEGRPVAEGSSAGPQVPTKLDGLRLYRIHDALSKGTDRRKQCLPFEGTLDFWVLLFITVLNLVAVALGLKKLTDQSVDLGNDRTAALFSFRGCESQNIQMIALVFAFIEATPGLLFFMYMLVQGTFMQWWLKIYVPLLVLSISAACFLIELRVGLQYLSAAAGKNWTIPDLNGNEQLICAPSLKP